MRRAGVYYVDASHVDQGKVRHTSNFYIPFFFLLHNQSYIEVFPWP